MEENKLLSYAQLRDEILVKGKQYFQKAQLHKPNYEIQIRKETDNFQNQVDMVFLFDLNCPEKKVPAYDLMIIYENYIRCRDAEKVIHMLSSTMEKQYPYDEIQETAEKEEFYVKADVIDGNEEIGSMYLLSEEKLQCSVEELLKKDEVLGTTAEKEKANLHMIPYGENAVLIIPVNTMEEYNENLEILAELRQLELEQEKEAETLVYDRSRNVVLKNPEEIKELLIKGKVKKKGIFSR